MKFSKFNMSKISIIALYAIVGILVFACGSTPTSKRVITVSIQPQKHILEKIVGDKFEITSLLSPGSNPEAYEPNLSHLMNLEKSEAYFRIGNIGFELAIVNKAKNNNPDLKIYDNSFGVDFIEGSHGATEDEAHRHEIDPHIWSSVPNMMKIAENMYNAILQLDPKNKKYYTKNYNKVKQNLMALNDSIAAKLLPLKGTAFAVWHPSLSYFARDYGLKQVSLEYDGKESSVKHLQKKIAEAKDKNIKIFFFQKEFDSKQAETINEQIGAKMVSINPMNYNWQEEMLNTANALAGTK